MREKDFYTACDMKRKYLLSLNMAKLFSVFRVVYEEKNITKASVVLNKTKSSISRDLQQLESFFSEKLFIRNGRNGINPTYIAEDIYFYARQITDLYKIISEKFTTKHNNTRINVCCHQLGVKYLLRCFDYLKNVDIEISTNNRHDAFSGLVCNKYDIIFFPLDNETIANINASIFYLQSIRPYNLCLFMSKNNCFAKYNDDMIGWNELKKMNIVPINDKTSFNIYLLSLEVKDRCAVTTTLDINLIKEGVEKNLWVACLGEEFADVCNCEKIVIKRMNSTKNITTNINWCICCKQQKLKEVAKIISLIKKCSDIQRSFP